VCEKKVASLTEGIKVQEEELGLDFLGWDRSDGLEA
jgi:hypothetical protein